MHSRGVSGHGNVEEEEEKVRHSRPNKGGRRGPVIQHTGSLRTVALASNKGDGTKGVSPLRLFSRNGLNAGFRLTKEVDSPRFTGGIPVG